MSEQNSIPLAQELAHCQCFLEIESQRFGTKLAVDIHIPDEAQGALVPPMLLQPLVENAVKHGIAPSTNGGTVHIHAAVRDAWLHLWVENPVEDGHGTDLSTPTHRGLGLGLRNTRQRLASLYGEKARLTQQSAPDRFVVEVTLPLTTAPTAR
jgi:sensor histidine kinase YesM